MAEPGISGPVTLGAKLLLNDKSMSMKLAGSIRDRRVGGAPVQMVEVERQLVQW